jgi:GntR family transcriptional regulator/MocR family aminotransferase
MEDPGYLDVRAALIGAGAAIVPVPVDAGGLDVEAGVRRAPGARLAVVSPSHQYPSGATLAAPRRAALLEWARRAGAWIVEDDYDSFFRYRGRPLPALQRFDTDSAHGDAERVIYVGTFSKTMFPSLRLGFCVVTDELIEAAANARAVASRNAPLADQAALAAFIGEGHYDRHLRRARLIYQERYEAMRASFARELGGIVSLAPASAGTHVIARFTHGRGRSHGVSAAIRVARAAAAEGLVAFPLSRYCLEPPAEDALVLGYGAITPRRIAAGAAKLAQVIARTRR